MKTKVFVINDVMVSDKSFRSFLGVLLKIVLFMLVVSSAITMPSMKFLKVKFVGTLRPTEPTWGGT